jgi:glycosyltransferase involved in cell wall biosynthesis
LVARAAGIPIIWRAGGFRVPLPERALLWLFARFVRPDLLLCNGEAVRRRFHPLIGGPVAVLPNGVDPELFGPAAGDPKRYRPLGADLVVGFAGRLAHSKHVEDVVELAARLRVRHPGVRVLVAGAGSERAECERMAAEEHATNLTFLGFVSDMPSFYAACEIVVLPSDSEGCSNVLLEAMRSEKVVVTTDIPPVLELVKDHETGLIYPLGDVAALTLAVEELVAHPELRATLARNAGVRAARLTARAAAVGLAALIREVVGRTANAGHRAPGARRLPPVRPTVGLSSRVAAGSDRSTPLSRLPRSQDVG